MRNGRFQQQSRSNHLRASATASTVLSSFCKCYTHSHFIIRSHLQRVDSFVLLGEGLELITKLGGSLAAFNFDLPSQGFEVKNVLGTFVHLDREELPVVGFLV